jgi:hypothetical protein
MKKYSNTNFISQGEGVFFFNFYDTVFKISAIDVNTVFIIYIDPERGGFGGILPEVMIFSEGHVHACIALTSFPVKTASLNIFICM